MIKNIGDPKGKVRGLPKIKIRPLGTMDILTEFHGNPSNLDKIDGPSG